MAIKDERLQTKFNSFQHLRGNSQMIFLKIRLLRKRLAQEKNKRAHWKLQ